MRIYLDNCCYNRPFDDQRQLRIRIETEAKLGIQEMISTKRVELAWSYIIDYENTLNPFEQRKLAVQAWRAQASCDTGETDEILKKAEEISTAGFKSKDALHLSCAIALKCDYFLTTDDYLLKNSKLIKEIIITDPVNFIREITI